MEIDAGARIRLATTLEPLRRQPHHASELVSEALGGELLHCLAREGEWLHVRGEDQYEGWLNRWTCELDRALDPPEFVGRFSRPLGTLWVSDHRAASPLFAGLPLLRVQGSLEERGGKRLVAVPWGGEGWLDESEIMDFDGSQWTAARLCEVGRGLLGTSYRWGGRSPLGFDCSGFVQYVFALADRRLPRDARQQVGCGVEVALNPNAWKLGDLLFFGEPVDHVGMFTGRGRILHCSGRVREEVLSENPHLVERLCAVRRVHEGLDDLGASWWAGRVTSRRS